MIFKLPLLTCAFYVAFTIALEIFFWAMAHLQGVWIGWTGKHWFWTLGAKAGLALGTLWFISFAAAWCIVYTGIKARLS